MNVSKVKIFVAVVVASLGPGATLIGSTRAISSPTCLVEVDGQRYVDGSCRSRSAPNGDFSVGKRDGLSNSYRATVETRDSNSGFGYWNKGTGQVESLGHMTREGSCWRNARARICGW
jgi:hypothetical protein